jgi:hypothetical protein
MFEISLALLLIAGSLGATADTQEPAEKPSPAAPISRPCSAQPVGSDHKEKSKGKSTRATKEALSACLDVKSSPLEIQEFFQNYVRAQGWRFGEEKIVEDGWIFARYLDKDELLQFAKEGVFAGRVKWTEGRALVQVTTREIDGGFTRVEISARMQGIGQNADRFAPPKDTWDLDSSGVLEKNLIDALDAHVKSLR